MRARKQGNTLVELSLLMVLVVTLGVASVRLLGNSMTSNVSLVNNQREPLMRMSRLDFSNSSRGITAGSVTLTGPGYYTMVLDPQTGQPRMQATSANGGKGTNATSIDGKQWNVLGTLHLGKTLEQMAAEQTDPAARDFLLAQARDIYYMGAAQGEIDGVPGLELGDKYCKIHALKDIRRLQGEVMERIANPPASLDQATYLAAMAMTTDIYNIGQTYVNDLRYYLDNNINFQVPSNDIRTLQNGVMRSVGNGAPGQTLDLAGPLQEFPLSKVGLTGAETLNAENYYNYDQLKTTAARLLADHKVDSARVEATLSDGSVMDSMAATTTQ